MSDTLPDLATCLPSDFLNHHHHHHVPYDFASSSSTESESDEDDVTELTRRFTRSVSLQERFINPYPLEKRGFSSSAETTLNRNISGPVHACSSPATPFGQRNEDCWDLIYAAAEQVAMMKMKMKMNALNDAVFANRGLLGASRLVGAPVSHHYFPQRVTGGPVGLRHSAWPPLPVETQRHQQPVHGGFNGVVKKERSGTGVFLPRNYPNIPPELKKKPACSPTYMPAGVARSLNKYMDPIIAQPQPQPQPPPPPPQRNIHGGFAPPYELIMARRNAVMLAHQRRAGVAETREVVLPQEWTY